MKELANKGNVADALRIGHHPDAHGRMTELIPYGRLLV
jgi:hypothetical protein